MRAVIAKRSSASSAKSLFVPDIIKSSGAAFPAQCLSMGTGTLPVDKVSHNI